MDFLHLLQDKVVMIVTLLVILSVLVVAHEWGHFIAARMCGVRVDDFSIGFGKRLFRLFKRGDTEYNVRLLPLGGFVKIAGMEADEEPMTRVKEKVVGKKSDATDTDADEIPLLAENSLAAPPVSPAPDEFYAKPLWQRAWIIFAGPLMSFVFGYLVLCLIGVMTGIPTGRALNKVGLVIPGGEGQRVGLRTGDVIDSINGTPMRDGKQLTEVIHESLGKPLSLAINRDGRALTLLATPKVLTDDKTKKPLQVVKVVRPGAMGPSFALHPGDTLAAVNDTPIDTEAEAIETLKKNAGKPTTLIVSRPTADDALTLHGTLPSSLPEAALPSFQTKTLAGLKFSPAQEIKRVGLAESVRQGNRYLMAIFSGLATLVNFESLRQNAGGIIFMGQATGLAVKSGASTVLLLAANLSISLCIFNLLPIPILDGGHLLTFFLEWIRGGKKLTPQQQQNFLMTGLFIIGFLFVLILTNDILRTVRHQLPQ